MNANESLLCVIGPTASGKTARAVALAKEHGGEVISVDSRQVYRMLDIGTEKCTTEEMQGIPHHLIDIKDPKERYSAGDFVVDARRVISEIRARGNTPILAGGTHFYFDALINGLPEETPEDPVLRERLEQLPSDELFAEIQRRDPRRALEIDSQNRRRLVRALEVIAQHGHVPKRSADTGYTASWVVLTASRDELQARIVRRLNETLARGLIEEVRRVREYVGDSRLNELGLEYKIVGEYIRGEREEASLLPALSAKLFQYARRQEAWIRKLTTQGS